MFLTKPLTQNNYCHVYKHICTLMLRKPPIVKGNIIFSCHKVVTLNKRSPIMY